jgi:hypothetical protein
MLRPGGLEWMEWNGGIRETMDDGGMRVEEWVLKTAYFPFTLQSCMAWYGMMGTGDGYTTTYTHLHC